MSEVSILEEELTLKIRRGERSQTQKTTIMILFMRKTSNRPTPRQQVSDCQQQQEEGDEMNAGERGGLFEGGEKCFGMRLQ